MPRVPGRSHPRVMRVRVGHRQLQVLRLLAAHRLLTTPQVQALAFETCARRTCEICLQRLHQHCRVVHGAPRRGVPVGSAVEVAVSAAAGGLGTDDQPAAMQRRKALLAGARADRARDDLAQLRGVHDAMRVQGPEDLGLAERPGHARDPARGRLGGLRARGTASALVLRAVACRGCQRDPGVVAVGERRTVVRGDRDGRMGGPRAPPMAPAPSPGQAGAWGWGRLRPIRGHVQATGQSRGRLVGPSILRRLGPSAGGGASGRRVGVKRRP